MVTYVFSIKCEGSYQLNGVVWMRNGRLGKHEEVLYGEENMRNKLV